MGSGSAPVPARAPRADASARGLGTDAYRLGGERGCPKTPGRTALLALAVWPEVWALRAHPARVAAADRRRGPADRQPKPTTLPPLAAQLGQRRQGLARLLDRAPAGLMDQPACAPRLSRLRQRSAPLAAPRHQLAEEAALHPD
jgi:hypothetical protein